MGISVTEECFLLSCHPLLDSKDTSLLPLLVDGAIFMGTLSNKADKIHTSALNTLRDLTVSLQ